MTTSHVAHQACRACCISFPYRTLCLQWILRVWLILIGSLPQLSVLPLLPFICLFYHDHFLWFIFSTHLLCVVLWVTWVVFLKMWFITSDFDEIHVLKMKLAFRVRPLFHSCLLCTPLTVHTPARPGILCYNAATYWLSVFKKNACDW